MLRYHRPNCHVEFLCNNYPGSQREVVYRLTDVCACHLLWSCMLKLKMTKFSKLISNGTANTAWTRSRDVPEKDLL